MLVEGPWYLNFIQTLIKCENLKTQKQVSCISSLHLQSLLPFKLCLLAHIQIFSRFSLFFKSLSPKWAFVLGLSYKNLKVWHLSTSVYSQHTEWEVGLVSSSRMVFVTKSELPSSLFLLQLLSLYSAHSKTK